ncbi:indole-3-acetic acid-amido synthetase GH3.5-like [Papaver somniferum]|uniref:indole-3-acetic acid-amido synthetase GH3.5-like n=1 Tax=Papaver somniferum TaxID=3469 RepID=UPI000E701D4A|nr:indole-3-acetic acid-amido synthetase GH3.5-like [Papaver somniferum]
MDIPDAIDDSIAVAENSNIANCSDTIDEHYHDKKNKEALQFIEEITINADEVQNQALAEILSCNAQVDCLQRHGLNGQTYCKTFKIIMPVVTYEDIKPDIDLLIAKGNSISSTLCKSPISQFFRSTGTSSGMSKLIPSTEEQAEKSRQFCSLLIPVLNQHIPGLNNGKAMQIIFVCPCTEKPGGIISSLVSTSVAKTSRNLSSNINYTSPIETILYEDTHQSLYSQLLCGLYQNKQVLRLGFAFASGFMVAVKCLQQHWTLLCDDIRHGTIAEDHPKITDPSVRKAVMKILVKTTPNLLISSRMSVREIHHGKA